MKNTVAVLEHLNDNKCDVCLVQETFLRQSDEAKLAEIKDTGWMVLSDPRKHRRGGGIAILYKPSLMVKLNSKVAKYKTFQVMETVIIGSTDELRLVNIYRPPYTKKARFTEAHFLEEFELYLDDVLGKSGRMIMVGDFNIHVERPTDCYPKKFLEILSQHDLFQCVPITPTHDEGGTLDLVITTESARNIISDINVLPEGTPSDHYLVHFDVELHVSSSTDQPKILEYRDFGMIDMVSFKNDLLNSVLCNQPFESSLDDTLLMYHTVLTELMDKHCPLKKKLVKNNYSPWFDDELKDLRKNRRKAESAWRKAKKDKEGIEYVSAKKAKYSLLRKDFAALEFKKMSEYKQKSLMASSGDSKALFKKLNRLLGNTAQDLPTSNNNLKVAEDFGKFFLEKVQTIRRDISDERSTFNGTLTESAPACMSSFSSASSFREFTVPDLSDIKSYMGKMSNKFCVLDPIPTFLFKHCVDELSPIVHHIVRESLTTSTHPTILKRAVIKPTLKKNSLDPDILKNYRPVSNLSVISKLIEKVVLDQLNAHLDNNDLHCTMQSGYRANHSCETLLVKMIDEILGEIDSGKMVLLVLLDLSAAFDTIDHKILLEKLCRDFGIDGLVLKWFESYLEQRSFSVKIGSTMSPFLALLFGVPQGSLLGPIIFILYIKELQDIAERYGLIIKLYADDSQLYISFNPKYPSEYHDVIDRVNKCLGEIKLWMIMNFMKVNESKTELLILAKPLVLKTHIFDISVDFAGTIVHPTECKEEKWTSLGVKLDASLTMARQINNVKQKCNWTLHNMWTINRYLNESVRIMMVKQLNISRLDNCNVLYIGLSKSLMKKLRSILNGCIRFIYNVKDVEQDLLPFYKKSHILPIKDRIDFKVCLLCFKFFRKMVPAYFQNLLSIDSCHVDRPSTRTRPDYDDLLLKQCTLPKTLVGHRRFSVYAPTVWNALPYSLRSIKTVDSFKKSLKTHFFTQLVSY